MRDLTSEEREESGVTFSGIEADQGKWHRNVRDLNVETRQLDLATVASRSDTPVSCSLYFHTLLLITLRSFFLFVRTFAEVDFGQSHYMYVLAKVIIRPCKASTLSAL